LYAATEHGSVYAFDATTGSVIWQTGLASANEQPADSGTCSDTPQERGITATPVIDRTRGPHGAIYVIANTKDSDGNMIQRIHGLDIATGAELFSGPRPVATTSSSTTGVGSFAQRNFDASQYQTIAGLQLLNGNVYAAWGPNCNTSADSGWVIGFDADGLFPSSSLYLAPASGPDVPGFTETGLSADSSRSLYVFGQARILSRSANLAGALVSVGSGNAFLKLSTENGLSLLDYSKTTPSSTVPFGDANVGVPGAVVLPDFTDASGKVFHLALGASSDGNIYLLNRDSLGNTGSQSSAIIQVVQGANSSVGTASALAYFGEAAYYASPGNSIKAFAINNARLSATPVKQSGDTLGVAGAQISISAKGATGGILWAVDNTSSGTLSAYDAADISREIYNSMQAANSRDVFTSTASSASPTIAGGRVYIAAKNGIVVFGQLK
jgi:hypothetical protein